MQSQTSVPAQVAIAQVLLCKPDGSRSQTAIVCDHFDCCELAQRVANQYPQHTILATRWLH
ncbi:hypothetical protein H6F87_29080 [Cyanobacteria bacterium FACHB-502]|nr:hypothetical protein [Cyanobacteria bacterium FACHB-502]